jgi:ATP-binding cassette subfamily F protein 3
LRRSRGEHGAVLPSLVVAVVIASNLVKEMNGRPLFRSVSFKLERSDRMALSGPNGAGKTTLLRMLYGDESIDGGELVFGKDVRVALADQRPPDSSQALSLRDYVLSGASELAAIEAELSRLEHEMAAGADDRATPMPRHGSSTRAATAGVTERSARYPVLVLDRTPTWIGPCPPSRAVS